MPGIIAGALTAHPPVLLREVGGSESDRLAATAAAFAELDVALAALPADRLLLVSPHGPVAIDELPLRLVPRASGHLARFGAPRVALDLPVDLELAQQLIQAARAEGFRVTPSDDRGLDHGSIVPLWLLPRTRAGKRFIFLGISAWSYPRLQDFGRLLHRVLQGRGSAILIASGDLSHRLIPAAPYGFRPEGQVFDDQVVDALRTSRWEGIEQLPPQTIEAAGECGLRPLTILLGAAAAAELRSSLLSYEGPFGVGYPVARVDSAGAGYDLSAIARDAITRYLRSRETMEPPDPIPAALQAPSAVFVTLRHHGALRGCVGSIRPTRSTAAHEIIRYAIAAAVRDPRFDPVALDEVAGLSVGVQLLDEPEPVHSLDALDPAQFGLIVRSGDRQGLLLPGVEGIRTPAEQLAAARHKAGIDPDAQVELLRFRTRTMR